MGTHTLSDCRGVLLVDVPLGVWRLERPLDCGQAPGRPEVHLILAQPVFAVQSSV